MEKGCKNHRETLYSELSIKKDLNLQIHLHKTFFSDDQFLESVHKSFLNQNTLGLRREIESCLYCTTRNITSKITTTEKLLDR